MFGVSISHAYLGHISTKCIYEHLKFGWASIMFNCRSVPFIQPQVQALSSCLLFLIFFPASTFSSILQLSYHNVVFQVLSLTVTNCLSNLVCLKILKLCSETKFSFPTRVCSN